MCLKPSNVTQKSTVKQDEIQEFTCYQLNIKLKTLISKLESVNRLLQNFSEERF